MKRYDTGKEKKLEVNLNIEKKDVKVVKEFLEGKTTPVTLEDIVHTVAMYKTQDNRAHKVKVYNPDCEYKVGDLIYKEYPGKIPVGAKKYIEIDHGVVLHVTGARTRFGIDEVQLNYDGTSEFKKYTAYLDRQKIELLLPHKQAKPPEKPEYISADIDPRRKNAPLERRDFNILKKKLAGVLNKESDIAFISCKALMSVNLKEIEDDVFGKIRDFFTDKEQSESTEFFVENFVRVKPDDPDFDAHCFALNYRLTRDFKIDFQQTQHDGWGKWNLISVIYYTRKNSPICEDNPLLNKVSFGNKKNLSQRRKKFEEEVFAEGNTRYYLTQREVTAGALRLKSCLFDLGDSIEVELLDGKTKKPHLLYYYSDDNLLLGFKNIFEKNTALQGMSVVFEELEGGKWQFTIRTTKKGTIADKVQYDAEARVFQALDEKVASPVFVNKSMFLEADIFKTLAARIEEFRKAETLNKLIHKIFLEFGIKERNYEIHILRLYHILDIIFPTPLKVVEELILANAEFVPSEKLAGVFYLDSEALAAIEDEEIQRKAAARDEFKKKREDIKRKKHEEEERVKEEIRRKREERRRKREEEMWKKEKLKQEREEQRKLELQRKQEERRKAAEAQQRPDRTRDRVVRPAPKAAPIAEEPPAKETHRKAKKKTVEEKGVKTQKRAVRKPVDEKMSEDDIKKEIQLEELKEKMRAQARRDELKKEKKVAYKDKGSGFGGIFASKLDEIVKKDDDKDDKSKT